MHDAYRVNKGGKGSFDQVMRGLEHLRAAEVEWNALTTVHAVNADHGREVYRFLRDECGASFVQFIPIIERVAEADEDGTVPWTSWRDRPLYVQEGTRVTGRSVTGEQYGRFLIDVFEEWVRRDVGEVYVQMFDVALANWVGEPPGLCVHSETCGLALALEHTGDLYSCDHFVEPRYKLGNIKEQNMLELVASQQQRQFGLDKRDTLPQYCLDCDVRFACHGGCPKDRFIETPDGEPGLNYLCPGFKDFFHHVDRPMRTMGTLLAQNRAPSEIVAAVRGRRRQARPQRPVHVRLRPQMEELPRRVDAARQTKRSRVMKEEPMNQNAKTSAASEESRPAARVDHFTVEERVARGKAARGDVPRSTHAAWEPPKDRRSPVELLEEQARTRVPELVPIRYGRMLVSPFTFYRGAAYLMASDLSGLPRSGLRTQLCGDAHLSNFGAFAAPDRQLVFSINDFDETLPGPFEWDVKRLVTSFEVAGRDRGFDDKQRAAINETASRAYREAMAGFAGTANLDLWYTRIDVAEMLAQAAAVGNGEAAEAGGEERRQGANEGQPQGVLEADRGRRRRAAHHQRPALDHNSGGGRRGRGRRVRALPARDHPRLPAHAGRRPPPPARALPLRPCGTQGRRRRQRRHEGLDHAPARPRQRATRSSSSSRRPRPRCWSRSSATASSPTTASASSRASG